MFENAHIRNHIVKPYFENVLQVDRQGQYPLPDINKMLIPPDWQERVEKVIIDQGYKDGPWMYKGAKMCLHWKVWHYAFPDAKWIIVRRKPSDIINSCERTGFMNAFSKHHIQRAVGVKNAHDGWLWWVRQHHERFTEMMMEGLNIKAVWPERMVNRNYSQTQEMLDWLGLKWTDEIFDFIEPKLWKARN